MFRLLLRISLFFMVFIHACLQARTSDLHPGNSPFHITIQNDKKVTTLREGFIVKDDVVYLNGKILSDFGFTWFFSPRIRKLIVRNQRDFIQISVDTNYVMFGDKIYYVKLPVIEGKGEFFFSEVFFCKVLSRVLQKNIVVMRGDLPCGRGEGGLSDNMLSSKNVSVRGKPLERIVIDPGHGGEDEGAIADGVKEKDLVLDIAKRLKAFVDANSSLKAYLTRNRDEFIPLRARTQMGRSVKADLFLSLHLNASIVSEACGVEVYVLDPETTDEEAALIAKVENSVLRFEDEDYEKTILDDIFSDISITGYKKDSLNFAEILMRNNKVFKSRGIKQAPFVALTGAGMPSVLLELGFITNPGDRGKFFSNRAKQDIVKWLFYSILEFKEKFDQKYGGPQSSREPIIQ